MKFRYSLLSMFFLLVSFHLNADGMAGIGTEAAISLAGPSASFDIGINGQCIYSGYAFPSKAAALYAETGGIITYWPSRNILQTKAAVTGELSYQAGSFLWVPSVKSRLNALFPLQKDFSSMVQTENLVSSLFSFGNKEREFRIHPRFHFNLGTENSFGPGGELGYIFSISPATLFDISVSPVYLFLEDKNYRFTLASTLGLTSYPLYGFSTTTEIWYKRSLSSALSLLGDYSSPLPADTYHELGIQEEMLISISPALDLNVYFPVALFLKDHPALEGPDLLDSKEYLIQLNPELKITADLAKQLLLECSIAGEIPISNSDYQRVSNLTASAVLFLTF